MVDFNDMCGFVIVYFLGVKYVVFFIGFWYFVEVGVFVFLVYVLEFNLFFIDRMNFLERMKNIGVYFIFRIGVSFLVFSKYERIM